MEKQIKENSDEMPGGSGKTRSCMRCGLIFHYTGSGHLICPNCREADMKDFDRVREYLYDHQKSNIAEISEGTGVSVDIIESFLKGGRMEIPNDSDVFIRCERCNKEIRSGRFCASCAAELTAEMKQVLNFDKAQIGVEPERKGKMHYKKREK